LVECHIVAQVISNCLVSQLSWSLPVLSSSPSIVSLLSLIVILTMQLFDSLEILFFNLGRTNIPVNYKEYKTISALNFSDIVHIESTV